MDMKYVCRQCGAEDHDHTETPPQLLNCWSCGAGLNVPLNEMRQRGLGMYPEAPAPETPDQEVANG